MRTLSHTAKGIGVAILTFAVGVGTFTIFKHHNRAVFSCFPPTRITAPDQIDSSKPCREVRISASAYPSVKSLRALDYRNLAYISGETKCAEEPDEDFKLRNGICETHKDGFLVGMKFLDVAFGDVTGDGREEAMVSLQELSDGNGIYDEVYIFALERHRPRIIFTFSSGDRAEGGLRRAYAKDGNLVLELWGPENTLARILSDEEKGTDGWGLCCPLTFTRSRYEWRNENFQQVGEAETLDNPHAKDDCPICSKEERARLRQEDQ